MKELHYLCIQMDDKRYLQSLINEGEHQQQDFKYRVTDACKLAKSVSAFANTNGGCCISPFGGRPRSPKEPS